MNGDHIDRLRIIPAAAKERDAGDYFARSAIRKYPVPDDFPHAVNVAINCVAMLALTGFLLWLGWGVVPFVLCALRGAC